MTLSTSKAIHDWGMLVGFAEQFLNAWDRFPAVCEDAAHMMRDMCEARGVDNIDDLPGSDKVRAHEESKKGETRYEMRHWARMLSAAYGQFLREVGRPSPLKNGPRPDSVTKLDIAEGLARRIVSSPDIRSEIARMTE
jgi:hypothetical protein